MIRVACIGVACALMALWGACNSSEGPTSPPTTNVRDTALMLVNGRPWNADSTDSRNGITYYAGACSSYGGVTSPGPGFTEAIFYGISSEGRKTKLTLSVLGNQVGTYTTTCKYWSPPNGTGIEYIDDPYYGSIVRRTRDAQDGTIQVRILDTVNHKFVCDFTSAVYGDADKATVQLTSAHLSGTLVVK